jgi:hypothetical protein
MNTATQLNAPYWADYAEYDYFESKFTGRFFDEEDAETYEDLYIDEEQKLGLEPLDRDRTDPTGLDSDPDEPWMDDYYES